MKKIISLIITLTVLLLSNATVFANSEIPIFYNDQKLEFSVAPEIIDDVTMVPLRDIFEAMGYTITWNNETKTVTGEKGINTISLTIGKTSAYSNGNLITIAKPIIKNDYTLVPLRFVAESSGSTVDWNGVTRTVSIYSYEFLQNTANKDALTENDISRLKDTAVTIYTDHMQGSGIIVSEDGYIITNFHVLEDTSTIQIRFNSGETYSGYIHIAGYDVVNDIVVLKIDKKNLIFANTSVSKPLSAGDYVLAIGSPDGIPNVSSTGNIDEITSYAISSTAKVYHGSSGGGLFNSKGELVGITSATLDADISLSIPISLFTKMDISKNISFGAWKNIKSSLVPPETVVVTKSRNNISIRWSNVYGADSYKVYISVDNGKTYTLLKDIEGNSSWDWGFPECVGIYNIPTDNVVIKVSSIKNKTESKSSTPVKPVYR